MIFDNLMKFKQVSKTILINCDKFVQNFLKIFSTDFTFFLKFFLRFSEIFLNNCPDLTKFINTYLNFIKLSNISKTFLKASTKFQHVFCKIYTNFIHNLLKLLKNFIYNLLRFPKFFFKFSKFQGNFSEYSANFFFKISKKYYFKTNIFF